MRFTRSPEDSLHELAEAARIEWQMQRMDFPRGDERGHIRIGSPTYIYSI